MTMCIEDTPVEYFPQLGLSVKREDMACPGGPNFSKTRGVYRHIQARPETLIGVLDTAHSAGGWAAAKACKLLGKRCAVFYPKFKVDRGIQPQQEECRKLGAELIDLPAGRSAVLYHSAKKYLAALADIGRSPAYMLPNALKLDESVSETAAEVLRTKIPESIRTVLVSASSGTIAAGVLRGLAETGWQGTLVVHLGYSRPLQAVRRYIAERAYPPSYSAPIGYDPKVTLEFVDEGYKYADKARPGEDPPFQCNNFYDLKLFRHWLKEGRSKYGEALLWNIG